MNSLSLREQLENILSGLAGFGPETVLALVFMVVVIADLILYRRKNQLPLTVITFIGLMISGFLVYQQWVIAPAPAGLFLGMLQLDSLAIFIKFIFLLAGILLILLTLAERKSRPEGYGEYLALLLAMLLGLHLMAMAANLLILYLAIELVSIGSYVFTTFSHSKKSVEGGIKYLLFGAVSSGIMLYGMSLLYGFTGTLQWTAPGFTAALAEIPPYPLLLALFLTIGGLLFKISAAPFHLWTPDVYESAPTPVVAFFSVAPKAAGIVVLLRVFHHLLPDIPSLPSTNLWVIIALLTLTIGNFAALWQKDVKRLLAYSSIAHAGFLLAGVLATNQLGWQSVVFYLVVYLFMNFAAFTLIILTNRRTDSQTIEDYRGMGMQYPLLGIAFLVVMIALTGLPPTVGFTAKLFLFSALWQSYESTGNTWLLGLFIWGLANVAVALVYYLKVPFFMFFRGGNERKFLNLGIYDRLLIITLTVPLLLFFFKPDWLMNWITRIAFE